MRFPRQVGWFALGTALLGLGALPGARVPIIGDDMQAYFETYALVHGGAFDALAWGWRQGTMAGHFNPVGQALGALYHYSAFAVSSATGLSPQAYDLAAGGVLLWLTVLAAATALAWGLRHTSPGPAVHLPSLPRVFALLAAVTGTSLQLHPWTNDPVTTFGMAGWGSAAIGFLVLGLALRSTVPGRTAWSDLVWVAVAGVVAVLYYEELVGMVAAAAAVLLLSGLRARRRHDPAGIRRVLLLAATGVVVPAIVFVAGRYLAVPSGDSNYTGTTVAFGPQGLATWWAAMLGALPGGGWPYLIAQSGGSITLTWVSFLLAAATIAGLAVLAIAWVHARRPSDVTGWAWAPLVAGVVVGWALTTATQAFTPKYISEIHVPGQVYLYYAVGVVCVSMLVAWVVIALGGRLRPVAPALLILVGAFVMVQVPLNWQLGGISEQAFTANRHLSKAASDDHVPPQQRCTALLMFAQHPWPDYYRKAVVPDAMADFQAVFDTPLCPDPVVVAKVQALLAP